jgi:DNA (cytosine-5)-methyltransferase 1
MGRTSKQLSGIEQELRQRLLSRDDPSSSSVARLVKVEDAPIRKWVPRPLCDGKVDWGFLAAMLHELHGSPRHGNPSDPLDCLIYVMLSRKTPITVAGKLFRRLKRRFATWDNLLTSKPSTLRKLLSGGGLEETRTGDLRNVLAAIKHRFGTVTLSYLDTWGNRRCLAFLTSLPGVGKKTALCVMMYALGRKVFPADAHCIRVLTRLGLLQDGLEHREAQDVLLSLVPREHSYALHVNLVAHGQTYCLALNPRCEECPIRLFCATYRKKAREQWSADNKSPTVIDLFSGAGGTSLGLQHAGYRILAAIDHDFWAGQTFRLNHPEVPEERILLKDIRKAETLSELCRRVGGERPYLVIGGPPCQGFSMIGERIRGNVRRRFIDDPRNRLYRQFVGYVNRLHPKVVVMENVPALYSHRNGYYKQQIIQDLSADFAVEGLQADAYEFGAPQHRKRVFFIGVNVQLFGGRERAAELAREIRERLERYSLPGPDLRSAIGDLPALDQNDGAEVVRRPPFRGRPNGYIRAVGGMQNPLLFNHVSRPLNVRDQLLYRRLKPGEKAVDAIEKYNARHLMVYRTDIFDDKYRRLDGRLPCPTIMAHLSHDGHMYIHPDPTQIRSITVREAARIQSFPDDFVFYGPRTHQFRDVGNAVPPLLAAAVGRAVKEVLQGVTDD